MEYYIEVNFIISNSLSLISLEQRNNQNKDIKPPGSSIAHLFKGYGPGPVAQRKLK